MQHESDGIDHQSRSKIERLRINHKSLRTQHGRLTNDIKCTFGPSSRRHVIDWMISVIEYYRKPRTLLFISMDILDTIVESNHAQLLIPHKTEYRIFAIICLVIASKYYDYMNEAFHLDDFLETLCELNKSPREEILKLLASIEIKVLTFLKWIVPIENILFHLYNLYNRYQEKLDSSESKNNWLMAEYIAELSLWNYQIQKWNPWYLAFAVIGLICHSKICKDLTYQHYYHCLVPIVKNDLYNIIVTEKNINKEKQTSTTEKFSTDSKNNITKILFTKIDLYLEIFLTD